ncbi:MAG: LuxR C-terminal-related transcriptional regulator [Gammaproteobacteria bacterium]
MYWDRVLNETLNKYNPNYPFYVTHGVKPMMLLREPRPTPLESKKLPKKFGLGPQYPNVFLTEREAEVVYHYANCKSGRAVALKMELSPRTIEFYLKNIKAKLQCQRKQQLLEVVRKTGILNQLAF